MVTEQVHAPEGPPEAISCRDLPYTLPPSNKLTTVLFHDPSGYDPDGFDNLPKRARPYLQKILIPRSKTAEIEKRLAVAGIDEVSVYPDLDGLGRWLAMVLRDEAAESAI